MTQRRGHLGDSPRPRRGARSYLAASGFAQACALARYTLLARLIGPEQLGLAATLILTAQFFDSITDSGADRFLIQDRDGDTPAVQKMVQLVFVGRGLFSAAALLIVAVPMAALFRTPALAAGLAILALSPFIAGFTHLDMRRAQRHHDFRTESVGVLIAESVSLLVTVAAAWLTRSFVAILFGLITRSLVMTIVSQVRAERPYRLAWSRDAAPRLIRFATPLLFNGLLLFLGSQGDRVVVADRLGLRELGFYSAVLMLIYYPSVMVSRYMNATHLPRIAAARRDPAEGDDAEEALGGQTLLLATAMLAGFAVVAPWAVRFLYGARFAQPALIVVLIGVLQATRFIRLWPNTIALAMGRSGVVLANNIARLVGIPLALWGVVAVGGLEGVVLGYAAGEFAALATGIVLVNRARGVSSVHDFDRFGIYAAVAVVTTIWTLILAQPTAPAVGLTLAATAGVLAWLAGREFATIRGAVRAAAEIVRRGSRMTERQQPAFDE